MCLKPRSIGVFQNGGYATHVLAPHPQHLVDPGTLDPALAATYACSGITVYSAIRKLMPMPPDEALVLVGAGGLGLSAVAQLQALGHRNTIVVDISRRKAGGGARGRGVGGRRRRRRGRRQGHHRGGGRPGRGDHRPGQRHRQRRRGVRRAAQRRQTGAGRPVRRRAAHPAAADGRSRR